MGVLMLGGREVRGEWAGEDLSEVKTGGNRDGQARGEAELSAAFAHCRLKVHSPP